MAFSPKRKVVCDMVLIICGYGGTGRLEGFRFLCQPACGFESHYPHQNVLMKDATQKTPHKSAAFSHIMRHFWNEKVAKTRFFKISVLPRERRHFEDAPCQICGLVWFEHRGLKKNKKAGHRSAPYGSGRRPFSFHWCLCCFRFVCLPFLGGVGNSFLVTFRVCLRYKKRRRYKDTQCPACT